MYKKTYNSGFTLLEVMLAMATSIILLFAILSLYEFGQRTYNITDTKAEITQNGRVIIDRLVRELRQTGEIVTTLPEDNSSPESLPDEIMFQDGHTASTITYIRYYLSNSDINRQLIAYYFDEEPSLFVRWYAVDEDLNPPTMTVLEDKLIGEFVYDIEFWGEDLININLYLLKDGDLDTINTAIYGRNL